MSEADIAGREGLCKYILRPQIAQERVQMLDNGLVRILLERPFRDGTVAIDLEPLSLLCRFATAVPPPRFHSLKYAGVLASAHKLRSLLVPPPPATEVVPGKHVHDDEQPKRPATHRCRRIP